MKRCTRLDLDSEMENFIKIGKDLGLEGDKLLQFAEKKEAEAIEREERNKERELRKLEIEAEKKRLEADAENKRLEAVEAEKRRAHELEMKRLELNVATRLTRTRIRWMLILNDSRDLRRTTSGRKTSGLRVLAHC